MSEKPPVPKIVPAEDPPREPDASPTEEPSPAGLGEVTMEEYIESIGTLKEAANDTHEAVEPGTKSRAQRRKKRGARAPQNAIGDADSFIDTPREHRDMLEDTVKRIEDTSAQSRAEAQRAAVQEAEAAYLIAYKELEQKKTIWNRLAKGSELKEESEKVASLKRLYDEKRVTYAEALTSSARERLTDDSKVEEKVERYNRIVRFREVVKPAAEKRLAARKEALDARGRSVFEKALGWSARQNQLLEKRLGKSGAIAVRALIGAVGISGIAAAAGGFGAAALTGAGVYGVHKFARGFIGAYAGKLGGDFAGKFYEDRFGRSAQEAAKRSLKNEGRRASISLETLQSLDALRENLSSRADEATLQRKKALVQALTAYGIGAGAVAALSEVLAVLQAADTAVDSIALEMKDAVVYDAQEPVITASSESVPPETPSHDAVPEAPQTEAVIGKGEGLNQLFVDLRASGLSGDSPVIRHLLDPNMSASELSAEVKALVGDESAVMQVGDTLLVDADGNLVFERGGVQQVLMENTDDGFSVHALKDIELRATDVAPVETVSADEPVPAASPDAVSEPAESVAATVGTPLTEFASVADAETATPEASSETLGRSLEDFSLQQDATQQPATGLIPENDSGTTGRSLEDFEPMRHDDVPGQSPEIFTNVHGVDVNPSEPAAYVWKVPGTDTTLTLASGGTPEQQSDYARAFADTHPGSTVHFVTPVFEDGIVKYRMDVWDSVEGTPAQRFTDIVPGTGVGAYPDADPQSFIRKLP